MFTEQKLNRLQWILLGAFVVLLLLYWFGFRLLSERAASLDRPLDEARQALADAARQHPMIHGVESADLLAALRELDQADHILKAVGQKVRARIRIDPMIQSRLDQPFQLFEFDRERFWLVSDFRRLAAKQEVALDAAALGGYPEFDAVMPEPILLWPQTAMVHEMLTTILLQKPRAIHNVAPLQRRAHYVENRILLEEFPVRIQLRASTDAALRILRALPLLPEEMKEMSFPEMPGHKSAFFIDRFLVTNSTNGLHEVEMDLVVSGFMDRTVTLP